MRLNECLLSPVTHILIIRIQSFVLLYHQLCCYYCSGDGYYKGGKTVLDTVEDIKDQTYDTIIDIPLWFSES